MFPLVIFLIVFVAVFILFHQLFSRLPGKKAALRRQPTKKGEKVSTGLLPSLIRTIRFFNEKAIRIAWLRKSIKRRLMKAGYPLKLEVNDFLFFKELGIIILPLLGRVVAGPEHPFFIVLLILVGFFLPDLWLRSAIKAHQQAIMLSLPDVLDLLTLSIEAGLDFMLAINKIISRSKPSPFIDELHQVSREIRVGRTRHEALSNMAKRVDIPDITSLVTVLTQAEKLGTPLAPALRNYAARMRQKRFERAEALAGQAPTKMLFPMIIFIFPVIFIIIFVPIILQFMKMGAFKF